MIALIFTVGAVVLVFLVRNHLVYNIRSRRLREVSQAARLAIAAHDDNWERLYDEFDHVSYDAMMYDLTRWTYQQFYSGPPQ